jgi:hypothetical protein
MIDPSQLQKQNNFFFLCNIEQLKLIKDLPHADLLNTIINENCIILF